DGFTILETDPTISLITADGDAVSDNHVIKNNVITNPTFDDGNTGGGWGILLGGTGIDGADNNTFDMNEISLNPDLTKNELRAGLEGRTGAANMTAQDNCFSRNGTSPPTFSPCPFGPCTVTPFEAIRIEDDGASPGTMGTMIHNNSFAGNNAPNGITDNSAAS